MAEGQYFDRQFLSRLNSQTSLLQLITMQNNKDSLGHDLTQQAEQILKNEKFSQLT